jgi:hypothetical protein
VRLRTIVTSLLGVLLLLHAGGARAQTEPGAMERAAARKLYDEGRVAAEERRWGPARDAWQASHDLVPNALVLVSLAGAQAQTGRLVDALESYRRFLLQSDAQTEHFEPHVREQVAALEARIAHLKLLDAPADTEALLDGAPLSPALVAAEIPLDPGAHVLELRAPGHRPWTESLTLAEGQHLELAWRAEPLAAAQPLLPAVQVEPQPVAPLQRRESTRSVRRRRALWTTVGVVAAVGLAASLTLALRRHDGEPRPEGEVVPVGARALRFAGWR